jgi:hypothetical protein
VEAIVGEGVSKKKGEEPGIIFLVKWRNYNASHNSWEPLLGLAGLEDMIEVYREQRKKENAAAIEAEEARRALEPARDAGGVGDAAGEKSYTTLPKGNKRDAVSHPHTAHRHLN